MFFLAVAYSPYNQQDSPYNMHKDSDVFFVFAFNLLSSYQTDPHFFDDPSTQVTLRGFLIYFLFYVNF